MQGSKVKSEQENSKTSIRPPRDESELEELLSRPNAADLECARRLTGDVMILGAGGKMGPSLALRVRRAFDSVGATRRVFAVSRFSDGQARDDLERQGIDTISCDLLDEKQVGHLPGCENVLFLAGRKFGSTGRSDLIWAINTVAPALVGARFRASRVVVFSTGNVYPFVPSDSRGSVESDAPAPVGEYAQSCLGRERVFEYFSRENGASCLIFRLNYAIDLRYGVLVDVAQWVWGGRPIELTVPCVNALWQGDANSYAFRSLEHCQSPPRVLNVTGPERISIRSAAEFFSDKFRKPLRFEGQPAAGALLSDASLCHKLLGLPEISLPTLMEWIAHWIEAGGATLDKPTKFEVINGRY